MAQFLPKGLDLPRYEEINASLLITKYAEVKTEAEKEDSKRIAEYSCKGKVRTQKGTSYSTLPKAHFIAMKLGDRLIIDQSGGIQENANLSLHSHFGFPVIPGSALKGAARHHVWEQWKDAVEEGHSDLALEKAQDLVEIFGFPTGDKEGLDAWCASQLPEIAEQAGKVAFLPALPYGSAPLEVDVLTCHHANYYAPKKDKKRATDDENPIPVFFPVVKAGATFEFVTTPTSRGSDRLAEKALGYLKLALETNGIGAKTAAGYGWFEEDRLATESLFAQKEKAFAAQEKANLSPIDLAKRELLEIDGTGFGEEAIKILSTGSENEQHALVLVLGDEKKDEWKSWKKRAKKKQKLQERVEIVRSLAKTFGEELI